MCPPPEQPARPANEKPIYVMSPDMHAYVQIGKVWQEVPLEPAESNSSGV